MWQFKKPFPWNKIQPGWTTTWPIIWYSDYPAEGLDLDHEMIHATQQKRLLVLPWWILYVFGPLPILFNPFRYRMEYQAYKYGSLMDDESIEEELGSSYYGWLSPTIHRWCTFGL